MNQAITSDGIRKTKICWKACRNLKYAICFPFPVSISIFNSPGAMPKMSQELRMVSKMPERENNKSSNRETTNCR